MVLVLWWPVVGWCQLSTNYWLPATQEYWTNAANWSLGIPTTSHWCQVGVDTGRTGGLGRVIINAPSTCGVLRVRTSNGFIQGDVIVTNTEFYISSQGTFSWDSSTTAGVISNLSNGTIKVGDNGTLASSSAYAAASFVNMGTITMMSGQMGGLGFSGWLGNLNVASVGNRVSLPYNLTLKGKLICNGGSINAGGNFQVSPYDSTPYVSTIPGAVNIGDSFSVIVDNNSPTNVTVCDNFSVPLGSLFLKNTSTNRVTFQATQNATNWSQIIPPYKGNQINLGYQNNTNCIFYIPPGGKFLAGSILSPQGTAVIATNTTVVLGYYNNTTQFSSTSITSVLDGTTFLMDCNTLGAPWLAFDSGAAVSASNLTVLFEASPYCQIRSPTVFIGKVISTNNVTGHTVTLTGALNVGHLAVTSNTSFNTLGYQLTASTITNSGTIVASNSTVIVSNALHNTGTFSNMTSTVVINGSGNFNSNVTNWYNLYSNSRYASPSNNTGKTITLTNRTHTANQVVLLGTPTLPVQLLTVGGNAGTLNLAQSSSAEHIVWGNWTVSGKPLRLQWRQSETNIPAGLVWQKPKGSQNE